MDAVRPTLAFPTTQTPALQVTAAPQHCISVVLSGEKTTLDQVEP